MPLSIPTPASDIAAEVWAYADRILTSLKDPADIVKFIGKGTGTEVPTNKSLYDLLALDRWDVRVPAVRAALIDLLPNMGGELAYVADEVQATLNTTHAFLTLGSRNITVALPTGASRVRAIALALIHIANRVPEAQEIDLRLNVEGATVFEQNDVVSFGSAEGSTVVTIVQDCTAQVTGDGTFSIQAYAQLASAHNTTFTVEYLIFVQYRMS